jgi:Flp pilus assembly protein TadB
VSRNPLIMDIAIAVLAAILILVLTPGVAVAGLIALLVLAACGISLVVDSRRRRRAAVSGRRRPAHSPRRHPPDRRQRAGRS